MTKRVPRKPAGSHENQPLLFDLPASKTVEPKVRLIERPLWTEDKARLIQRYFFYFVLVTRHGTYLDGFAGPQDPANPDTWAARLVLESEPRWLRHFYFFEKSNAGESALLGLRDAQPSRPKRTISIQKGDFNAEVLKLLQSETIKPREATFCLLDQRTFECRWETVKALAQYKTPKIELFYFLPNLWLDRALSALKDRAVFNGWWGRPDDFHSIREMNQTRRMLLVLERFRSELGYLSAKAWPILERRGSGHIMYYMIHATDHPAAPLLMGRAYRAVVAPSRRDPLEQLVLACVEGQLPN